jgi:xanthine phosphoribosyltransferase
MESVRRRIVEEGRNLGNGILKIDSFLNHQVDALLMEEVGCEMARRFESSAPTRVLTAEVSGILPALMAARGLGNVPMVYARKHKPITMREPVFVETAPSHTKGGEVTLMVSPEFIGPTDRILVVDDFLASGQTIEALVRIAQSAGASVVGIAVVVEKSFEGGRERLSRWDIPIESMATISDMSEGAIVVAP